LTSTSSRSASNPVADDSHRQVARATNPDAEL
jgi:hypothetical protein